MKNAPYICQSNFLGLRTSLANTVASVVDHVQFQLTAEIIVCNIIKNVMQVPVHGAIHIPGAGAIASGNGVRILIIVIESLAFQIIKAICMIAHNSTENVVLRPTHFFIKVTSVRS